MVHLDEDDAVVVWMDRLTYIIAGMIATGVLALVAHHC